MPDDLERLRTKSNLLQLLAHYVQLAEPDRSVWQDRLMAVEGLEPPGVSKLHGELIAFGWIEQNTGNTPVLRAGAVPGCYRVTLAGLRAVQQIQASEATVEPDDASPPMVDEKPVLKKMKRKREKSQEQELVASSA